MGPGEAVEKRSPPVDECFPLFRFEHEFLLKNGCRSYWIGHPDRGVCRQRCARSQPSEDLRVDERLVAFLPGSRESR